MSSEMIKKQIDALQHLVNTLFGGRGTITLQKIDDMSGQFMVAHGGQSVPLGDHFESAYDRLLAMGGVAVKTAKPKLEWGERRGRPRKDG